MYQFKIGMIASNRPYVTAINPYDIYKFVTRAKKKNEMKWR